MISYHRQKISETNCHFWIAIVRQNVVKDIFFRRDKHGCREKTFLKKFWVKQFFSLKFFFAKKNIKTNDGGKYIIFYVITCLYISQIFSSSYTLEHKFGLCIVYVYICIYRHRVIHVKNVIKYAYAFFHNFITRKQICHFFSCFWKFALFIDYVYLSVVRIQLYALVIFENVSFDIKIFQAYLAI